MLLFRFALSVAAVVVVSAVESANVTIVTCDRAGDDALILSRTGILILRSEAYPSAFNETRNEMCNVVLENSGGWHPETLFWVFPHGLIGDIEYAEVVVSEEGIEALMGFATIDTSEGDIFSHASESVVSFLEVDLYHGPDKWVGFQMHATLIDDTGGCAFADREYSFSGVDQYNAYFLASSWHSELRTTPLPARNCTWIYDAPEGFELKFVRTSSNIAAGEVVTLTSGTTSIIFNDTETSTNVVYYFGHHLEVRYQRVERPEESEVGFAAVVSAFWNATKQDVAECAMNLTLADDDVHHIVHKYSNVDNNCSATLARVSAVPGFELHIEVDSYELETCCDKLYAEVTDQDSKVQRYEIVEFSQLTMPWTSTSKPVELVYEKDGNIEYSGIDLKAYRINCSCATMEKIELKDDGIHDTATIRSYGEVNGLSYCNNMNCGWIVSVPADEGPYHYSLSAELGGNLRHLSDESLTMISDTLNATYTGEFDPSKFIISSQKTQFNFRTGYELFTACKDMQKEECSTSYFFRAVLSLLKEDMTTPSPTPAPLPPVTTRSVTCDEAGEDALMLSHSSIMILKSEAYPLAFNETRQEMCNVVIETPGGWHPKNLFWVFPHGLIGELEYSEALVGDLGIETVMGFAHIDTSEGDVFWHASISVVSFLQMNLYHGPNKWVGFQMHATLIENSSDCAFAGHTYTFDGSDQYDVYYLGSSWHSELRTFVLPAINCTWMYEAPEGYELKFVRTFSKMAPGEVVTLISDSKTVTFNHTETSTNVVYYFGNHLEVRYQRVERHEGDEVGFSGVVSAFWNATKQDVTDCAQEIILSDDNVHHIVHTYSLTDTNCSATLARVSAEPGFELHIEVDSYELETCCDKLYVQVAYQDDEVQRFEMTEFSQLTMPWTSISKPVELLYEKDGNIEYSGINLKAYRINCSCDGMKAIELRDDGTHDTATIRSYGEVDGLSYCNYMNCGWSISIPANTSDFHYGVEISLAGRLRDFTGDWLVMFNGTNNITYAGNILPPKFTVSAPTIQFFFHSGYGLFTVCDDKKQDDCAYYYFFRADFNLVRESGTTPTPTPAPLKPAPTTVISCDRAGEDAVILSRNYVYILKSEAYPLAYNETRKEMCKVVFEAPGGWNPPTSFWVFPHALFDYIAYTEIVDEDGVADIYVGGASADTSEGKILRHSTVSIASTIEIDMNHKPQTWTGFQMHATLIEDIGGCPFAGHMYNFRGVNKYDTYFLSSSWHDANETYVLPALECQWGYIAPVGYIIKFVLLNSTLAEGETLTIQSNDTVTFISSSSTAWSPNTVAYFSNYLLVSYSRVSRNELPHVGFSAVVSAYENTTNTHTKDCSKIISVPDDNTYHVIYKYSTVDDNCTETVAKINPPAGFELRVEVDTYKLETCCDRIEALVTELDGRIDVFEIREHSQIALPSADTTQPVEILFHKDGNIEYWGFDLSVYRMKCSCSPMEVIELKDDGINNVKVIRSYGELDSRSYCNLMRCGYKVKIPFSNDEYGYSLDIALAGMLRDTEGDVLVLYDGGTPKSYRNRVNDRLRSTQTETMLYFNSTKQIFTPCDEDCADYYFWRADLTLVVESTVPTTTTAITMTVTTTATTTTATTITATKTTATTTTETTTVATTTTETTKTPTTVRSVSTGASSQEHSTESSSKDSSTASGNKGGGASHSRYSLASLLVAMSLLLLLS